MSNPRTHLRMRLPRGIHILRSAASTPYARYTSLRGPERPTISAIREDILHGMLEMVCSGVNGGLRASAPVMTVGALGIFIALGYRVKGGGLVLNPSIRLIIRFLHVSGTLWRHVLLHMAVSVRVLSMLIESLERLRQFWACAICTETQGSGTTYRLNKSYHIRDLTTEIERIGEWHTTGGGFAFIHVAHWRRGGQRTKVGVKVIKTLVQYGGDATKIAEKRLQREILVWSRLNHPNILRLLGVTYGFGAQGTYGMVCPWIDNGDLSHYLECHKVLPADEQLNMIRQIIDALCYLHSNRVVHGDLTGNNILVVGDGRVLLCDFGLSSINEDYTNTVYHTSSTPKYNLPWTAPEIVLSEYPSRPNRSTDVYSFGSVMYQILTGARPYHGMADGMIVLLLNERGYPPLPKEELISGDFWRLLLRCWERNPEERPTSTYIREDITSRDLLDSADPKGYNTKLL